MKNVHLKVKLKPNKKKCVKQTVLKVFGGFILFQNRFES